MMESLLWSLLGYVILPLWLLVGVVDFWTHQRTHLATTTGYRESLLHLAQMAQMGLVVLLLLFVRVNALVLLVVIASVVLHTLTAYWDISFSDKRRDIGPLEQFAHGFLIMVPIFSLALIVVLHWPAAQALVTTPFMGVDDAWTLHWRQPPWDRRYVAAALLASALCGVLPAITEFRQAWRTREYPRVG